MVSGGGEGAVVTAKETRPERLGFDRGLKRIVISTAFILVLMLVNLARAMVAGLYSVRLPDLPMSVSWAYLVARGLFWSLAFGLCAWGLVRFRPWGRVVLVLAVHLWVLNGWLDRILWQLASYARQAGLRDLVVSASVILIVWGIYLWTKTEKVLE
ncbi:MAG: hypothetical protein GX620_15560 [Chloroflexi bacterium]|nr:hypothetical protein [Chloroflexota bacterium]